MTDEGQGSNRVESASVHTVPIGNSNISSGPSRSSISERSATEPVLRQPPITSLTKDDENSKNGDAIQSASAEKEPDSSHIPVLQWPPMPPVKTTGSKPWARGRVLVIDYMELDVKNGRRRAVAQEINDPQGLKKVYENKNTKPSLRLIHVQDADWANRYLFRKYDFTRHDELAPTRSAFVQRIEMGRVRSPFGSGEHVRISRTAKTSFHKVQLDPWRGVNRLAFTIDNWKVQKELFGQEPFVHLRETNVSLQDLIAAQAKQRVSIYIQHMLKQKHLDLHNSPYADATTQDELDNGNVIVIFSRAFDDTLHSGLIPPRGQVEAKWRRLPFYLAQSGDDEVLPVMDIILKDIFTALTSEWDCRINASATVVDALQDVIYDNPVDDSRAPELWACSAEWMRAQKLATQQLDVVEQLINGLRELAENEKMPWLGDTIESYKRTSSLINDTLINPTMAMSDMIYQAVTFRDARQSLQLNTSLWRLSWITFIFLPLTFVVGFFGMNVSLFANNPSVKWYFITACPLMLLIFILQFTFKHFPGSEHPTTYERSKYKRMFRQMASEHPKLWTRQGPRNDVLPAKLMDRVKWRLLRNWFGEGILAVKIGGGAEKMGEEQLGPWTRVKCWFLERWLGVIEVRETLGVEELDWKME